ncbi:MAG: hypothetical protein MI757_03390 [Pirellulales bacterium]|nr:hypothetical protein [Pirellulales bacterium]
MPGLIGFRIHRLGIRTYQLAKDPPPDPSAHRNHERTIHAHHHMAHTIIVGHCDTATDDLVTRGDA